MQHTQQPSSKTLNVLFKPTHQCNLACHYCHAERMKSTKNQWMSDEDMINSFLWLLEYLPFSGCDRITLIWHGGEPLLVPITKLEKILIIFSELASNKQVKLKNKIQTNLTLISKEHIPIIRTYFNNKVGTSIDFMTQERIFPNGKDSTPAVLSNVKLLQDYNVLVSAISVLNKNNYKYIDEMYNFFKIRKISFSLHPCFPATKSDANHVDLEISNHFASALCQLADIWIGDLKSGIKVNNITDMMISLLTGASVQCRQIKCCQESFIGIGPNGEITPCDSFDSSEISWGNYLKESPENFAKKHYTTKLNDLFPLPPQCHLCKYKKICYGGCPHDRMTSWSDIYCKITKRVLSHLEEKLSQYTPPILI